MIGKQELPWAAGSQRPDVSRQVTGWRRLKPSQLAFCKRVKKGILSAVLPSQWPLMILHCRPRHEGYGYLLNVILTDVIPHPDYIGVRNLRWAARQALRLPASLGVTECPNHLAALLRKLSHCFHQSLAIWQGADSQPEVLGESEGAAVADKNPSAHQLVPP